MCGIVRKCTNSHIDAQNNYLPAETVRGEIVNITSPNFIIAMIRDDQVVLSE